MLVLSRQQDQKVLFPNLGITVEIVGVKGRNVKLGIDAPPEVRIIREELADEWDFQQREEKTKAAQRTEADQQLHQRGLNNQLNHIGRIVQIAQEKLTEGLVSEAIEHVESALTSLSNLDQSVVAEPEPADVVREQPEPYITRSTEEEKQNNFRSMKSHAKKWKALLVESDTNEQKLMATVLELSGITVSIANNGEEAIDYLVANEHPDFVLIDMETPSRAGQKTIEFIREQLEFRDLPIYGVSKLHRLDTQLKPGSNAFSDWLAKPVDGGQMSSEFLSTL